MSDEKNPNVSAETVNEDSAELTSEDLEKVSGGAFDAYLNFKSSNKSAGTPEN